MKGINAASLAFNAAVIIGMVAITNGYANTNSQDDVQYNAVIGMDAVTPDRVVVIERPVVVEKAVYTNELTAEMLAQRAAFIANPESDAEQFCMAQNIFFEAGIDNLAGMAAVANTVLNRVEHDHYPDTICGVIHQGHKDANGNMIRNQCQFSWYCDGKSDRIPESENWERAKAVAWDILNTNEYRGLAEGATHYHATYVNPYWSRSASMDEIGQIGAHLFYRWQS
jgi:spore germination cell wall hydrolase CwlJ-like protein